MFELAKPGMLYRAIENIVGFEHKETSIGQGCFERNIYEEGTIFLFLSTSRNWETVLEKGKVLDFKGSIFLGPDGQIVEISHHSFKKIRTVE